MDSKQVVVEQLSLGQVGAGDRVSVGTSRWTQGGLWRECRFGRSPPFKHKGQHPCTPVKGSLVCFLCPGRLTTCVILCDCQYFVRLHNYVSSCFYYAVNRVGHKSSRRS